uniref:Uncharacterized protein n=1 Tax=Hordeum vulgare subsp. vulgare TaxID=112509 RepID=A0A8I6YGG6_HORVV
MATKAPPRRWNTKRYILMALLGTLVGSGVVIAVSTILCPAVIVLSVTGSHSDLDGGRLNLILDVDDTSLRTGVRSVVSSCTCSTSKRPRKRSSRCRPTSTGPSHPRSYQEPPQR